MIAETYLYLDVPLHPTTLLLSLTLRGRGLDEWSMALQSVCIAVERKTVGSSPGVAVVFLQSQLVF